MRNQIQKLTLEGLCSGDICQQQRFYELIADVLQSIAIADQLEQAA